MSVDDRYQEALIAELMEMEFDAFEQQKGNLITYIPRERFSDVSRERIEQLLAIYPGDGFIQSEEVVADRNWNEEWEQTIKGQQIGPFYVKPTWDAGTPSGQSILLEIDPKMAFGTGYHETTRLMLKFLPDVVGKGDRVLDAGTGTGILAIAAVKLGAKDVFAFDIDEWSVNNARENILINRVDSEITIHQGSTETVSHDMIFDLILANINRNTILALLPDLIGHLNPGGMILMSGLLKSDRNLIVKREELNSFDLIDKKSENEWIALLFKHHA